MKLIRYSVRNPLIVNLLMITILIIGTISLIELPRELNPQVTFNYVFVIVPYPGAGAEEVEKILTVKIEDAVDDIDDIKMMSSESSEGSAFVWLQFEEMSKATFKERMTEVETAVNNLDLPEGTMDPMYMDLSSDDFIPVISVSIVGDMPERELRDLTKSLEDDLFDIDGVAKVAVSGTREREIWIEINSQKMVQHRISLSQVVQAVANRNMNLPAGEMTLGKEAYLVRTIGEIESPDGFSKIVVRWDPRGNHLYLGQIAKIRDGWKRESTRSRSRIDQSLSGTLSISKGDNANSLEVIEKVKAAAEKYRNQLPAGSKIVFTNDNSIYINDILNKLQTNALLGFLLVVLILYIFMGFRNAMVAAVGIPISFMATFIFMRQTGQTFNGSSLFGLMLVLGVVVDDAIIVVENCFRHRQRGLSRIEAAVVGTSEVFWPVITATLTTIAAFMPLILMTGIMGKFMRVIPIVVSLTLVASLIEVFLIAPSHFAEWGSRQKVRTNGWFRHIKKLYTRILVKIIRRRFLVGPAIIILMVVLGSLIPLLGVEMFHGDEFSQIWVWVTMPPGTTLEETDKVIKEIEGIAMELPGEERHAVIGNTGLMQTGSDWIYGDHVGQVLVDVVEKELRVRSMDEIIAAIRSKVRLIEGPVDLKIEKMSGGPPVGKPVEIKVKGKHLDELMVVSDEVKAELKSIPGVYDVGDDNLTGKKEIRLVVDEARAAVHGLSVAMIALEVRTALEGIEASIYREGDEEIDVRIKLEGGNDIGFDGLRDLNILAPTGALVRLDNVCRFEEGTTLFRIKRFENERAVTVSANIDKAVTSAVKVNNEIASRFEDIAMRHPGYRLDFRGEFREFQEAFVELTKLFLLGVILIFTILGAQFKAIRQAVVILLTIPFAFIGSVVGLIVGGNPFSILTMYGMVALAGIAVNDAIVMVTFINNSRQKGVSRWRSIIESGKVRLRPIILTSLTTILGLMPMAIGLGGKSESWGPFASTIIWGLLVATLMTLFVIPTVYSIAVDDWFGFTPLLKRIKRRRSRRIASA